MSEFNFVGSLPASKSMMLRNLVIQSFTPTKISGRSDCDDVVALRNGLENLKKGWPIDARLSAAVFRFMALRASRKTGTHRIIGHPRLLARPHDQVRKTLLQLGVKVEVDDEGWTLRSEGWRLQGDGLHINSDISSQYASAVLLSAWGLPFSLPISLSGNRVSEPYWQMTLEMVRRAGMKVEGCGNEYMVAPQQKITTQELTSEQDLSSAFSLAALAAVGGSAHIVGFPRDSLQADRAFPVILSQMGVRVFYRPREVAFQKGEELLPIKVHLENEPDLFPVLAALCSLAKGTSRLYGAVQLQYKESSRIQCMVDLLSRLGARVESLSDGLEVTGPCFFTHIEPFEFDPDNDHRLAMAAGLLKKAGAPIRILHPEVVNKSFPEFWDVAGVKP